MLQVLYGNSCSIANRERVIGPALAPIVGEHISNCSKEVDSGIVKLIVQYTQACGLEGALKLILQ